MHRSLRFALDDNSNVAQQGNRSCANAVRLSRALRGQTAITQGGISILDAWEDWEDAGRFVTKCKAQLRKGGITTHAALSLN